MHARLPRTAARRSGLPAASFLAAWLSIAALAATACGDLKIANDGDEGTTAEGGTTGDEGGSSTADGGGGTSSDGSTTQEGGGPVIGDPRFPLWPTPADAPADTSYVVTNGPDGATVKDKVTGLEWQDAAGGSTYDFAGAGAYCDALVYNGASDWRMPTRIEAISIMSIKPGMGESAVTGPAFTPVTGFCTWTASRVGKSTMHAFSVGPASVSAFEMLTSKCAARCVRGGSALGAPITKQYLLDATTVTDPVTGLVWERNPPDVTSTLEAATTRCQALSGGTPPRAMRLPTFKELAGIVDETRADPASNPVFGDFAVRAFSSNPRWTVHFDLGAGANGPPGFEYYSRCVAGP